MASLLALLPGVVLRMAGDGTVVAVAGDPTLLPLPPEDVRTGGLGALLDRLTPEDRAALSGATGCATDRLVRLDGRPLRWRMRPDGEDAAVLLLTDAADEAAALDASEAARLRAEERFRTVFSATPGLFAVSDPVTGCHIDVNQRWLDVMGWQREEVIGRTAAELGIWADPTDRAAVVAAIEDHGTVRDFVTRLRTRSGEIREFLLAGDIIEVLGDRRLLLVSLDVTERNDAQHALAALNADLEARVGARTADLQAEATRREQAEQRLRAILDGVADAVIAADAQGRIVTFNPAAERLFGLTHAEALGANVERLMPPAYAENHADHLRNFLTRGASSILGVGRELPAVRADGTTVPVEVALNHLEHDGEHLFIAVMRDVSERKEYEARLHAARQQAEDANRAKSAFLSSMSHELRTPMNAILGFAQLMETIEAESLSPRHREYIGHILSAGRHLLSLIDDVLDLSKIEAGAITLSLEPVGLDEVLEQVQTLLKPAADRFGVTLRQDGPCSGGGAAEDCHVWADAMRLGQVVLNLGSNAVKYNRPGGWVSFSCEPTPHRPGFLRLVVRDGGQGIPAHRLGEVFQPFNRLGVEGGTIEGTGIGLSIARQLLTMMGGDIGVVSSVGEGTTFWIDLPLAGGEGLAADDRARDVRHVTLPRTQGTRPNVLTARPWTVLYVEDNANNVRLMAGVLARFPLVRLLTAPTAEAGLDIAVAHQPDLVVLDINLPGMDGFGVLHRLRGTPELAAVPVIALTARGAPRDRDRGLRAGFAAYLDKPLDVGEFLNAANAALRPLAEADAGAMEPAAP